MIRVPDYMKREVQVKLLDDRCMPVRAHDSDAGADLFSINNCTIPPNSSSELIDTGVAVKIPVGYTGLVFSRSGMGLKGIRLANSVAVIDSDYRGTIKLKLVNEGEEFYIIEAFKTKIAQLVLVPIMLANFVPFENSWDETARSTNGFGSTGI